MGGRLAVGEGLLGLAARAAACCLLAGVETSVPFPSRPCRALNPPLHPPLLRPAADRSHVFFLAATNRPEALDPALTRPGRLDRLVRVPLPDAGARLAVLRSALRRCPLGADVDLAALAGAPTEGLSGADLAEACRRAGMAAIRELVAAEEAAAAAGGSGAAAPPVHPLQQHHLEAALAGLRRSVSTAEEARHAGIEAALQRGSLPAPEEGEEASAERRRRQAGALEHLVRSAAEGSVAALQQRVAQLEAALQAAGLEPPPATA